MAGLTNEELDSYVPKPLAGMEDSPETIRARSVIRDIYARHGIDSGTSLEAARQMIVANAASKGLGEQAAFANPEEAAAAQEAYAAQGKTPDEVQKRWEESIYLLPEKGYEYHQNYGRDAAFLQGVDGAQHATAKVPVALDAWDSSNNDRLYRKNWREGTYADTGGFWNGVSNALLNTDLASGQLVNASDVPYNFLAMQGSGEADTTGDSATTALGEYRQREQNRLSQPVPILDLPATASQQDRATRLRELQQETATAAVPGAGERWKRTTGIVPPPVIRDTGDAALAAADGTAFLAPGMKIGATAAKGAARAAATKVATDMTQDAATSAALAALGNYKPDRTWSQYLGSAPEAEDAVTMKSPEEVEAAQAARDRQYERTMQQMMQGQGVSTARAAAYKRLQESGKAPILNR